MNEASTYCRYFILFDSYDHVTDGLLRIIELITKSQCIEMLLLYIDTFTDSTAEK